jgi:hypothetical protein
MLEIDPLAALKVGVLRIMRPLRLELAELALGPL